MVKPLQFLILVFLSVLVISSCSAAVSKAGTPVTDEELDAAVEEAHSTLDTLLAAMLAPKASHDFLGLKVRFATKDGGYDDNWGIREELRLGKTPRGAVDAGFDRATTTIMDANITTLISAVVLFQFGTGPIKGFAVTLSIGVIASMFTAIVVSRLIFNYFLDVRNIRRLSI